MVSSLVVIGVKAVERDDEVSIFIGPSETFVVVKAQIVAKKVNCGRTLTQRHGDTPASTGHQGL